MRASWGAPSTCSASGSAEVRVRTESGGTATVVRMGRGECFGEMSLLSGDDASADVVAAEGTTCLVLEREAFERLVVANPRPAAGVRAPRHAPSPHHDRGHGDGAREGRAADALPARGRRSRTSRCWDGTRPSRPWRRRSSSWPRCSEPVLIHGEPGTGKELVARIMHFRGARREGPLLSVDCAEIVATHWGDHLFGPCARSRGPHRCRELRGSRGRRDPPAQERREASAGGRGEARAFPRRRRAAVGASGPTCGSSPRSPADRPRSTLAARSRRSWHGPSPGRCSACRPCASASATCRCSRRVSSSGTRSATARRSGRSRPRASRSSSPTTTSPETCASSRR